jgi:hypothetical protein
VSPDIDRIKIINKPGGMEGNERRMKARKKGMKG